MYSSLKESLWLRGQHALIGLKAKRLLLEMTLHKQHAEESETYLGRGTGEKAINKNNYSVQQITVTQVL